MQNQNVSGFWHFCFDWVISHDQLCWLQWNNSKWGITPPGRATESSPNQKITVDCMQTAATHALNQILKDRGVWGFLFCCFGLFYSQNNETSFSFSKHFLCSSKALYIHKKFVRHKWHHKLCYRSFFFPKRQQSLKHQCHLLPYLKFVWNWKHVVVKQRMQVSKWQDLRCNLLKNLILWWKKSRVCKWVGHLQPLTSAFVPYTTSLWKGSRFFLTDQIVCI